MFTVTGMAPTFTHRVKSLILTSVLLLLLTVVAGAALPVSAAAPQPGSVTGSTSTTGPYAPTTEGPVTAKPNGGTKTPKKPKPQPPIICVHYSQAEWKELFGEDPGPGGMTDCNFLPPDAFIM